MRLERSLPALLLTLLVVGPAFADKPVPVPGDPVVRANTAFAGDLFRQLRTEKGNLFFSPYSISVALAMTLEGARGDTAREMRETLQLPVEGAGGGYQRIAKALEPRTVRLADTRSSRSSDSACRTPTPPGSSRSTSRTRRSPARRSTRGSRRRRRTRSRI
jgi:hypothetical protein